MNTKDTEDTGKRYRIFGTIQGNRGRGGGEETGAPSGLTLKLLLLLLLLLLKLSLELVVEGRVQQQRQQTGPLRHGLPDLALLSSFRNLKKKMKKVPVEGQVSLGGWKAGGGPCRRGRRV